MPAGAANSAVRNWIAANAKNATAQKRADQQRLSPYESFGRFPVLRSRQDVSGPEVRFKMSASRICREFVPVLSLFPYQKEDRKSEAGKCAREDSRDPAWEWIELCAAELCKFVAAGEARVQKGESIALGKGTDVCGTNLVLGGMFADRQKKTIVQRTNVWHAKKKVPANLQAPRGFMKNPENFLCVFQYLIGNDQVDFAIRERQPVPLDILNVNFIRFPRKGLCVLVAAFNGNQSGARMKALDNAQISSRTRTQINDRFQIRQASNEAFHHLWSVGFALIREAAQRVRSSGAPK